MAGIFYNAIIQNIAMVKNDTMAFGFQIKGLEGQTPTEIYFTAKNNVKSDDYLFQRSLENGITLDNYDPSSDTLTYKCRIDPESTLNVNVGQYYYDLEIHINRDTFTLLKGNLFIDWEVTSKNNEQPTPGDDGDAIYYPIAAPEGKKEYTESYISQIAQGILDVNSLSTTYRTADMVNALALIRDQLDDISDAINIKLDEPTTNIIPLGSMAAAIASIATGLPLIDYMANLAENLAAVFGYANYGYWFCKVSDSAYMLSVSSSPIQIRFKITGGSRGVLALIIAIAADSGYIKEGFSNQYLYPSGKSDYYPIDSQELGTASTISASDFGTLSLAPFYNRDNLFYNLSASNLPRTLSVYANRNVYAMKNFIEGFTFGDLFNVTVTGASDAYLLYIADWDDVFNLCVITSDSDRFYYNRTNGQFIIQRNYWSRPGTFDWFATKQNISGQQSSSAYYAYNMTVEQLQAAIYFNTCDILDENGEVVIPANCTLADMGIS